MAVGITSLDYAGVWREAWPTTPLIDGSGAIAPDLSRSGRHASSQRIGAGDGAAPVWAAIGSGSHASRFGPVFDVTDYYQVTGYSDTQAIAAWVRRDGTNRGGLAEQYSVADDLGWGIRFHTAQQIQVRSDSVLIAAQTPSNAVPTGSIVHVAVAWDSDFGIKIWVGGTLVTTAAAPPPTPVVVPLVIGSAAIAGGSGLYHLTGSLADVLLRSTPWTDTEVAWLANPANDLRAAGSGGGGAFGGQLLHSPHLLGSFP